MTDARNDHALSKVPAVTLGFWIIKILATTLGETGGDAVTMSMLHADKNAHNGGYLIGMGIFLAIFVAAVVAQILTKKFNPWVYWIAIVASTTVGTAMADFFDRSLGIGYTGGLRSCSPSFWVRWPSGTSRWARSTCKPSRRRRWRFSTGSRSCFRRRSAPLSAIGWPTTPASGLRAARWCSAQGSPCSPPSTIGPISRGSSCFGRPSS